MTLRRRGGLGECDARTQGARIAALFGQPRTRQRAAQDVPTTQGFISIRVLSPMEQQTGLVGRATTGDCRNPDGETSAAWCSGTALRSKKRVGSRRLGRTPEWDRVPGCLRNLQFVAVPCRAGERVTPSSQPGQTVANPRRRWTRPAEVGDAVARDSTLLGTVECLSIPSYAIDPQGIIRWVNPAARALAGDVAGRHFTDVVAPAYRGRAREQSSASCTAKRFF